MTKEELLNLVDLLQKVTNLSDNAVSRAISEKDPDYIRRLRVETQVHPPKKEKVEKFVKYLSEHISSIRTSLKQLDDAIKNIQ